MQITLIDPKGTWAGLNSGLAYLAGSLINAGHTVEVLDLNNYDRDEEQRLISVRNSDLIGISLKTSTLKEGVRIAHQVRKMNPAAILICGGVYVTIDGPDFMREHDIFEIAVLGEGEETIIEITEGKNPKEIDGIIFRDGNTIRQNKSRTTTDPDRISFPNYDCFDSLSRYNVPFPRSQYPLLTSRGCPYDCAYCCAAMICGRQWRSRSPKNIIEELQQMKQKYGLRSFNIIDDNCTVKVERMKQFCRLLVESDLRLAWECSSGVKANLIDEELIALMKKAGVFQVNLGIEHSNSTIRRAIGRTESIEEVTRIVAILKSYNIRTCGCFMIGLPGSNRELDLKMVNFVKRLKLNMALWSLTVPYPGTPLFKLITQDNRYRILKNWKEGIHANAQADAVFDSIEYPLKERRETFLYACIRTKYYAMLVDVHTSFSKKMVTLLKLVIKHDPIRIFNHLYWLTLQYVFATYFPEKRV